MERSELLSRSRSRDESACRQGEILESLDPGAVVDTAEALAAADSPFAALGYAPDNWKGYMEYAICRSLPSIAGPAMSGNYMGFTPRVLERCHRGLVHQQINLEHQMKFYRPGQESARDRIMGCCVATAFPRPTGSLMGPGGGWQGIPETAEAAPEIRALAVIFKMAEGVNRFLGDHLSGRRRRAVSIEFTAALEQMSIYVPSDRSITPLLEAPDEMLAAVTENKDYGGLLLGRHPATGEQLAWCYGGRDGEVEFRGTGVVERPADRTARIETVLASRGEMCSIPAARVPELLVGRMARLAKSASGAMATIRRVHVEGSAGPARGEMRLAATPCDPVLEMSAPSGRVWWRLSDVELA